MIPLMLISYPPLFKVNVKTRFFPVNIFHFKDQLREYTSTYTIFENMRKAKVSRGYGNAHIYLY